MRLIIEQSLEYEETEITVKCGLMDDRLTRLIEQIKLYSFAIPAHKNDVTTLIPLEKVYYFESVDNRTFLYSNNDVYQCDKKLYQLEQMLLNTSFVRTSKSCIINTAVVASVRAQLSGRIEATLDNGELQIVSRHYIKDFRDKFNL